MQPDGRFTRWVTILSLVIVVATVLTAGNGSDGSRGASAADWQGAAPVAASMTTLEIDAAHSSFTSPEEVPAGWLDIKFTNNGKEQHHVQVAHLNDGISLEHFDETLRHDEMAALELATLKGGPATIDPGGTGDVMLNLVEGEYMLVCLLPGSDGESHLSKGMIKPLTVTSSATEQPPEDVRTISMRDFAFELPETLSEGLFLYEVVNDGHQPHEIAIVKLDEGATVEEALAAITSEQSPAGRQPFHWVGGMQALSGNESGIMRLDLEAGTYVAVRKVPDLESGRPHIACGMVKSFTVE